MSLLRNEDKVFLNFYWDQSPTYTITFKNLVAFLNRDRLEHMLKHFPESGQELLYVKYNLARLYIWLQCLSKLYPQMIHIFPNPYKALWTAK